jgi:uncharacterized DUF497 family protein
MAQPYPQVVALTRTECGTPVESYGQRVYTNNWMPVPTRIRFDWDQANTDHIARHHVTPAEAEQVISGASLPTGTEDRGGEERHTDLGQTAAGRLLVVVWTLRRRRIRVVTAFPASGRWRALWRRLKGVEDG